MSESEICRVYCNGRIFEGWTDVAVSASLQDAAPRFRLSVTEGSDGTGKIVGWQIRPGDPVRIELGGRVAVDGYVDVRQAGYDAGSHGVEIQGRSKTADIIDSAAVTKEGKLQGPFTDYKLDEIARALIEPFGIALKIVGDVGAAFSSVAIQYGETVFEAIERLARLRGLVVYGDPEGALVLSAKKGEPSGSGLVEGKNIKRASATLDVSQLASDVFVAGSSPGNDDASGEAVAQQTAHASNDNAARFRPTAVVLEQPGGKEDMKARADLEMAQRAADQARAQITVYGWLKADGTLWGPGDLVHVTSPMLLLDREMGVFSVEFSQSDGAGTETTLDLVVPEALQAAQEQPAAEEPTTEDGSEGEPEAAEEEKIMAEAWSIRAPGSAA